MNTRLVILVFSVPLFMALSGLNGAFLYFREQSEYANNLEEQALSAAVTTAEFASSMAAPEDTLSDPNRLKAIRAAADNIADMDGFYLIGGDGRVVELSPSSSNWPINSIIPGTTAGVSSVSLGESEHPYVVATAPVANGSYVIARFDAAPLAAKLSERREQILLIVGLSGLIGIFLAWNIARRITRELEKNRAAIAALDANTEMETNVAFSIREAGELADAVRLIGASRHASAKRLHLETARHDRDRTLESALLNYRKSAFPSIDKELLDAEVAIRLSTTASMGSFYAIGADGERAAIVIGECIADDPIDAFAQAIGARDYLEKNLCSRSHHACFATAKAAYGIARLEHLEWRRGAVTQRNLCLISLTDHAMRQKSERLSTSDPSVSPTDFLDSLNALLRPTGVFAAIRLIDHANNEREVLEDEHA